MLVENRKIDAVMYCGSGISQRALDHLADKLENGRSVWERYVSKEKLIIDIQEGDRQAWEVENLLFITSVQTYSTGLRVVNLEYIMGEGLMQGDTLPTLMEIIYNFAKHAKATEVRTDARIGLVKLWEKCGMKKDSVGMTYTVENYRKGMN